MVLVQCRVEGEEIGAPNPLAEDEGVRDTFRIALGHPNNLGERPRAGVMSDALKPVAYDDENCFLVASHGASASLMRLRVGVWRVQLVVLTLLLRVGTVRPTKGVVHGQPTSW